MDDLIDDHHDSGTRQNPEPLHGEDMIGMLRYMELLLNGFLDLWDEISPGC